MNMEAFDIGWMIVIGWYVTWFCVPYVLRRLKPKSEFIGAHYGLIVNLMITIANVIMLFNLDEISIAGLIAIMLGLLVWLVWFVRDCRR